MPNMFFIAFYLKKVALAKSYDFKFYAYSSTSRTGAIYPVMIMPAL